jgi:hypothetical protein
VNFGGHWFSCQLIPGLKIETWCTQFIVSESGLESLVFGEGEGFAF